MNNKSEDKSGKAQNDGESNPTYDIEKQLENIRRCLSDNKMKIGFLLGAGCPLAIKNEQGVPLIPDILGLTQSINKEIEKDKIKNLFEESDKPESKDEYNVEDYLSRIRTLYSFVNKGKFANWTKQQLEDLDKKICDIIYKEVAKDLPNTKTPYHSLAQWINSIDREYPIEIFTTNYDLLIEEALEYCAIPYFDGFMGVKSPFFDLTAIEEDELPPRWARLWKLHGSLNWYQDQDKKVFRKSTEKEGEERRMIYPSAEKYYESRRQPSLAMMDQLKAFFKNQSAILITCGYSFRDEHINEVIEQGLRSNKKTSTISLIYNELEDNGPLTKLAENNHNLTALCSDKGIINTREYQWENQNNKKAGNDPNKFTLGDFSEFGNFIKKEIGHNENLPEDEVGRQSN